MKEILTIRVFDEVDDEIASLETDYRPIPRDGSVKYILRLTPDMADELGVDELHIMLQRDTLVDSPTVPEPFWRGKPFRDGE